MTAFLRKAFAFVTSEKFKSLLGAVKSVLFILLLIGFAFDQIDAEKFHTLQDALAGMAF